MLAIVDNRAPKEAIKKLESEFEVAPFQTQNLTYKEVSGHPDIFLFQHQNTIIAANNTPRYILDAIQKQDCRLILSETSSGFTLKDSTKFNCCVTDNFWLHKDGYTAPEIQKNLSNKKFIKLPQAYTRCTTLALSDECIITSDSGIHKTLTENNIESLLVDPNNISLPGFKYGFFGGTAGMNKNRVYFLGNILEHNWGKSIEAYLEKHNFTPICLCNGKLYDGGGIFFVGK